MWNEIKAHERVWWSRCRRGSERLIIKEFGGDFFIDDFNACVVGLFQEKPRNLQNNIRTSSDKKKRGSLSTWSSKMTLGDTGHEGEWGHIRCGFGIGAIAIGGAEVAATPRPERPSNTGYRFCIGPHNMSMTQKMVHPPWIRRSFGYVGLFLYLIPGHLPISTGPCMCRLSSFWDVCLGWLITPLPQLGGH